MTSAAREPVPALRSDAARNREALLTAARAVFAAEGIDAPLARIAQEAGVGRASLYRRFPDRESLVIAIFAENFDEIEAISRAFAGRPGRFRAVFGRLLEHCLESQGFLAVAFLPHQHLDEFTAQTVRLEAILAEPLAEALAAGEVEPHWTPADLSLVFGMLGGVLSGTPVEQSRAIVRRCLELVGLGGFVEA